MTKEELEKFDPKPRAEIRESPAKEANAEFPASVSARIYRECHELPDHGDQGDDFDF